MKMSLEMRLREVVNKAMETGADFYASYGAFWPALDADREASKLVLVLQKICEGLPE